MYNRIGSIIHTFTRYDIKINPIILLLSGLIWLFWIET